MRKDDVSSKNYPAIMPLPSNQPPSSSPWDLSTSLSPDIARERPDIFEGCIIFVYTGQICHFLHPLHIYRSTFFYVTRGGMELPASSLHLDLKQECRTRTSFELFQCFEFGTYLTVDKHTHVWLIRLNLMQTYTGDFPSTKEAPTLQTSSSIPLPRPYLYQPLRSPNHLHDFTKDSHSPFIL